MRSIYPALVYTSILFLRGLYSASIVLIASYLLIVQSIICYKNQKHFNQFTMSLSFCVILFYMIFWSPLPLFVPLRSVQSQRPLDVVNRSAQSRGPPDLLWSSLRYGRCKADIHRMSCTLVFVLIRVCKHRWVDIAQGKQ